MCDFGASRHLASAMTGNIGTILYMPPEILANRPYNELCDVYSFGMVMYELFFEIKPYSSDVSFDNLFALGFKVASGARPEILPGEYTEDETRYIELMKLCWGDQDQRPSFITIQEELTTISSIHI